MKIIGSLPENTIILVEFSINNYNPKEKVTNTNGYLIAAEKYLQTIKIKKDEVLTMKVISYHGKCYI